MDPNEVYARFCEARKRFEHATSDDAMICAAADMSDYWVALDEWLSKGGLLPHAWDRGR